MAGTIDVNQGCPDSGAALFLYTVGTSILLVGRCRTISLFHFFRGSIAVFEGVSAPITRSAAAIAPASRSRLRVTLPPRASIPGTCSLPRLPSAKRRRMLRVSAGSSLIKRSRSRARLVVFSFIRSSVKCCAVKGEINKSAMHDTMMGSHEAFSFVI
jgi:hypothetical protein